MRLHTLKRFTLFILLSLTAGILSPLTESSFAFPLSHKFSILEETTTYILVQYEMLAPPSTSDIQADIDYLSNYQLLPSERTQDLFRDLFDLPMSEGIIF